MRGDGTRHRRTRTAREHGLWDIASGAGHDLSVHDGADAAPPHLLRGSGRAVSSGGPDAAMIGRRGFMGLVAGAVVPARVAHAQAEPGSPTPRDAVLPQAQGDRLPLQPRVIDLGAMGRTVGKPGGQVRTLIGGQRDIRIMTINGYSRLVGYDPMLTLQPDILLAFEQVEDRSFTFHLRDGHRWSDGTPLTSEDFRYMWEDVLLNADLRPGGPPTELMAADKPPRFEVIDRLTVRYVWDDPNPAFLPKLAAAQPLTVLMPAHYMRQFHKKYQDEITLAALIEQNRVEEWTDLHAKMSRSYRPENPDLPSLDPWINTTPPPAEQFIFVRNPYFHRIDERGQQLPYIDKMVLNVSAAGIISAKAGAGECELQPTGLDFVDYPYLKAAEKTHPVKVVNWRRTQGSRVALIPNLNCADDVWRGLMQDARVRRALSLGVNRHEINMVSFFGLAREGADSVLPESMLYRPEYAEAWAAHDPARANALLDEVGLTERRHDGIRLLPDGRPMQIIVESAGESTLETDVLELVTDHWRDLGVSVFIRVSQRDIFRSRATSGEVVMSVWQGLDNAVPTPDMSPDELAPTSDDQLQWPLWGMYHYSRGTDGHPPDLPVAQELFGLFEDWQRSTTTGERASIWHKMLGIKADQVFTIGIVNSTLQPILISARMRNVPTDALYGFDPTCFLGVYMPDTFWLDGET